MADEEQWLDTETAGRYLGLPVRTILRLVQAGLLKATDLPMRFRPRDLDACLDGCRIAPGQMAHLNPYPGGAARSGQPPTTRTGRPDRRYGRRS